ncbi:MAG: hypothetical protein ABIL76_00915 [candidate division WOR-3 bacterium]
MLSLTFLISNCGNEVGIPPQKTLIKLSGASVIQLQYPLGNENVLNDGFEISNSNTYCINAYYDEITTDFYSYKTTYQTQDNKIQLNFDILYYKPYGILNVKLVIKNLTNENLNITFKKFYEGLSTPLIDENNQICYIPNNNYLTAIIPVYPNAQISSSSKTCLLTYNLNLGPYLISEIYYGYIVGNDFNELLNSKAICTGCRSVLASYEKKQVFYEIKGGTIVLRGEGIFRIYKVDGSIVYIGKAKSLKLKSGVYFINYNNFTKKEVIR